MLDMSYTLTITLEVPVWIPFRIVSSLWMAALVSASFSFDELLSSFQSSDELISLIESSRSVTGFKPTDNTFCHYMKMSEYNIYIKAAKNINR